MPTSSEDRGATVRGWLQDGLRVVRAVLVEVEGSAPFEAGATMYIAPGPGGGIEGSLTGGCVESAVVLEAELLLDADADGAPQRRVYGISDELAGTVGLTCGGTVHVFVHEVRGAVAQAVAVALEHEARREEVALVTVLDGPHAGEAVAVGADGRALAGALGGPPLLEQNVHRDAAGMLAVATSAIRRYGADGSGLGSDLAVHVAVWAAPPRMAIVGAVDFSAAMAALAHELGFAVTIADPRERFASSPRFARVATVLVGWPDRLFADWRPGPRDAVLVFTHDPKLDVPALVAALETDAGYIGALGSWQTTHDRTRRLLDAGVTEADVARIHAPCGMDLGGRTPAETALSVLAEIIAQRHGRTGQPLVDTRGPIHAREGAARIARSA
jgi:xanthine dehydrogenase accessory factor